MNRFGMLIGITVVLIVSFVAWTEERKQSVPASSGIKYPQQADMTITPDEANAPSGNVSLLGYTVNGQAYDADGNPVPSDSSGATV